MRSHVMLAACIIGLTAVCGTAMNAQARAPQPVLARHTLPTSEFEAMAANTASMELALLGVPAFTDAQRDSLEVIEQTLREQVLASAARIRVASSTSNIWRPESREIFYREVNSLMAARQAATERVRTLLTRQQAETFRRNVLVLDDWYGDFWGRYAGGGYTSELWVLQRVP